MNIEKRGFKIVCSCQRVHNITTTFAKSLSLYLGNIFMVAEIEENIQVGVEKRLAQVQVLDTSLEDVEHRYYNLLKSPHLLIRQQASNDLLHKFNHFVWI